MYNIYQENRRMQAFDDLIVPTYKDQTEALRSAVPSVCGRYIPVDKLKYKWMANLLIIFVDLLGNSARYEPT